MADRPADANALFELEGDTFVPSLLTTGPWQADAMHGGPPAALAGRLAEAQIGDDEFIARLNIELERPVPLVPLTAVVSRRNVSRRVTHIDVALRAGDTVVVSVRALVLQRSELPPPQWQQDPGPPHCLADATRVDLPAWASDSSPLTYHQHAVEHRMPAGSAFMAPGPAVSWVRLRYPVLGVEPTSGLCRVLAAADFGSGISSIYGAEDGVGLINADLSVALHRLPIGDFVCVDATTTLDPSGSALCVATLSDEHGSLGVSTQSLLGLRVSI